MRKESLQSKAFWLPLARHLDAVVLTGGEGPGESADHVRHELSLLLFMGKVWQWCLEMGPPSRSECAQGED